MLLFSRLNKQDLPKTKCLFATTLKFFSLYISIRWQYLIDVSKPKWMCLLEWNYINEAYLLITGLIWNSIRAYWLFRIIDVAFFRPWKCGHLEHGLIGARSAMRSGGVSLTTPLCTFQTTACYDCKGIDHASSLRACVNSYCL